MEPVPGAKAREPEEDWEDAGVEPAQAKEPDGRCASRVAGPGVNASVLNAENGSTIRAEAHAPRPPARIAGRP